MVLGSQHDACSQQDGLKKQDWKNQKSNTGMWLHTKDWQQPNGNRQADIHSEEFLQIRRPFNSLFRGSSHSACLRWKQQEVAQAASLDWRGRWRTCHKTQTSLEHPVTEWPQYKQFGQHATHGPSAVAAKSWITRRWQRKFAWDQKEEKQTRTPWLATSWVEQLLLARPITRTSQQAVHRKWQQLGSHLVTHDAAGEVAKAVLCTTDYKVLLQYYSVLQKCYSSATLLVLEYKVLLQYSLFAMRGATKVTLQHHQILRLPRKMTLMIDLRHIWNVIYNVRSNRDYPPTSPNNTAPATKNDSHDWSSSHMKRHLQCAEQQVSSSNVTKDCACHEKSLSWLILVTWHMKRYLQCPQQQVSSSNVTKDCACHEKSLSWLILVTFETLFTMPAATGVILQRHQRLRLPQKMTLMIDPRHIWNVIYNRRSNKGHPTTSPNTAPATKSDSHDWSSSHMKRHLKCAEQQRLPSNITKYCTCHEKWLSKFSKKFLENIQCGADPRMIREWNRPSATRLATEVTFRAHHDHFPLKNTTFRAPAIIPNFTKCCPCHEKWQLNFTKYCACHAKWLSWLILVTYETSFTMRGATKVTLQH